MKGIFLSNLLPHKIRRYKVVCVSKKKRREYGTCVPAVCWTMCGTLLKGLSCEKITSLCNLFNYMNPKIIIFVRYFHIFIQNVIILINFLGLGFRHVFTFVPLTTLEQNQTKLNHHF